MTTTTDTEAALLAAVCEHPDDDTPRLVYADYLDEQAGELPGRDPAEMRARAEFIRLEIILERKGLACAGPDVWGRRNELLKQWEPTWRRAGECPECGGAGERTWAVAPEDGGPVTDECPYCLGTGDAGGLTQIVVEHNGDGGTEERWRFPVRFRRGWLNAVEVPRLEDVLIRACQQCQIPATGPYMNCPHNSLVWQPTTWARALRAHRSLTRVVVGCRQPVEGTGCFYWFRNDAPAPVTRHHIPAVLFDAIKGGERIELKDAIPATVVMTHDTREAALDALAVAVCAVVRGHG